MAQNPSAPTSSLEPPSLLVVGAGPVGLVAACELRRHGLHVRVVERNRAPSEHSKALALHARTLEILSAHDGVVDALISAGTIVEGIEVRTDGHLAASLSLSELNGCPAGDDGGRHGRDHGLARREEQSADCVGDSRPSVWATRFPFVLMVPQSDTERILARCLKDVYGTDVEWQTELVRIRQDPSAVHVELQHAHARTRQPRTPATPSHTTATAAETGSGTATRATRGAGREMEREGWRSVEGGEVGSGEVEAATFDLVCACDGPHSTCRRQLGLSFDGLQYPMHALLADVALSHWPFPRNKGHVFTRGKQVVAPGVGGRGGRGGGGGGGGVLVALPFGVDGLWRLIFDEGTARVFAPAGLIEQIEARRLGKGKAAEGGGAAAGEVGERRLGERTGRGGDNDKSEIPYVEIPAGISSSSSADVCETTEVPPSASDTPFAAANASSTLSTAGVSSPALVSETAHHGPASIPSAPLPSTPPSAASASSLAADGSCGGSTDTAPSPSPVTPQQPELTSQTPQQPALTPQHVSAMLNAIAPCGAHVDSIHWCSVFSMHLRSLNRFFHSRVLFLGDAAHIHSPVGGQGLNTGVQDAYNAAWKVALVGRGIAGWELLNTYDTERRAAVAQVLKATDVGTRSMFLPTLLTSLSRSAAFFLLSRSQSLRVAAAATVAQLSLQYPPSSLFLHDLPSTLSSLLSSPLSAPLRLLPPPVAAVLAPAAAAAAAPGARAPDAMLLLLLPPSHYTHTSVPHAASPYSPPRYSRTAASQSPPQSSGGGSSSRRVEAMTVTHQQQQQQQQQQQLRSQQQALQQQQKAEQLQRAVQLQKASQHMGGGGWQPCSVLHLLSSCSPDGGTPAHHLLLFAGTGLKPSLLRQLRLFKDEALAAAVGGRRGTEGEEAAWKIPVSVHCVLEARAPAEGIVQACRELIGGVNINVNISSSSGSSASCSGSGSGSGGSGSGGSSSGVCDPWGHVSVCVDAHGYAYERYHGDACPFYLVRPDGHVALRAGQWQPGRAQAYFDGLRGRLGKAGGG